MIMFLVDEHAAKYCTRLQAPPAAYRSWKINTFSSSHPTYLFLIRFITHVLFYNNSGKNERG